MIRPVLLACAALLVAPAALAEGLQPVRQVAPEYPRGAERRGIEGHVVVEFTVTADGRVQAPKVIEAQPAGVFDDAAIKAVQQWTFPGGSDRAGVTAKVLFQL